MLHLLAFFWRVDRDSRSGFGSSKQKISFRWGQKNRHREAIFGAAFAFYPLILCPDAGTEWKSRRVSSREKEGQKIVSRLGELAEAGHESGSRNLESFMWNVKWLTSVSDSKPLNNNFGKAEQRQTEEPRQLIFIPRLLIWNWLMIECSRQTEKELAAAFMYSDITEAISLTW